MLSVAKWLAGVSAVACDVSENATLGQKKTTSSATTDGHDEAFHPILLYGCAAVSAAALAITGYYYYTTDENGVEVSAGANKNKEDEVGAEAALQHARESLEVEWTQTSDLNKASSGTLGFEAWWTAADGNSKKALLQSARDLMRQRLLQHQPDAAIALDVLCPEIGDARLDKLIRGNALVALIKLRITQLDAVRKHDIAFVKENLAQQNLDGKIQGVDAFEVLCDNRQLLMMTFLCDVLILCRHMGNFPTMLRGDEADQN
ncbi:hypothetical protein HKI87_13g75240 [Chloropicon roscoffensis]|uniref:Uncharacterized protein n=1 Tax=Chloropicon roscoffensis TaxID=1461544 RepID=A0AAX4PJD3_9CHLO